MIDIQLLGEFNLVIGDGSHIPVNSTRLQHLFAYLLIHANVQISRRHLAFILWANKTEAQAYNNLRQALHQLRQTLSNSERYIYLDASTLYWRGDSDFRLDVNDFLAAIEAANQASRVGDYSAQETNLEKALGLYRGELLPSCYDDWIIPERERLHLIYLNALEDMIHLLEHQRLYSKAILYAKQLLKFDQLNENTYRILMRLYALKGERANALNIYHRCVETLQSELGEEPEAATQEIYHRLLRHLELSSSPSTSPDMIAVPPLVGREIEWQHIIETWQKTVNGSTRLILLEGEAGIGKSRLAEELLSWVRRQGYSTARTRSYAAEGRLAYDPIVGWLRSEAVRPVVNDLANVWKSEIARLLPELLIDSPDLQPPGPLKENWQRQSFYQALVMVFNSLPQPVLLLIDDLQWCDPDTLEWLHYLLRVDSGAHILIVGTLRSEEVISNASLQKLQLDLRQAGQITEIEIGPLDAGETARLAGYAVKQEINNDTALRLFRETEGNPLFVLETVQIGFKPNSLEMGSFALNRPESERTASEALHLPPKVYALITARLAQCSTVARDLAGFSAIVGRAFTSELLAQASNIDVDHLALGLDELWKRRIVRMLDANTYDFTHDKIREVAYAEISPQKRRLLHRRIAEALKTVYASRLDEFHAQVAAHYEQAGVIKQAIPHYYQSAMISLHKGASAEATGFLQKGLEMLQTLPESSEQYAQELELQSLLGVALVDRRGHGAPEILLTFQRVQALSAKLGRSLTPPVLRALAIANVVRANFRQAIGYSEQLLDLAETVQDSVLVVEGCYVAGVTHFWLGDFLRSQENLERAIEFYLPDQSRLHISLYAQDPQVICLSRLASTYWCLGYPAKAIKLSQAALDRAVERGHRFSTTYARVWDTRLHLFLGNTSLTEQKAAALVAFCQEHQDRYWLQEAEAMLGWAQAEHGETQAGIASIQGAMESSEEMGMLVERPFFLVLQARLLVQSGDLDLGLRLLDEALEFVEMTEERWCEAEIYRCQGELFEMNGDDVIAEAAFRRAVETAHRQSARMLELRAALALGKLWLRQGKYNQAKEQIIPLYNWFTEGLDTPDLQNTRVLLSEIERHSG